jgi:1,4-alpha-glucan branching enzyme
MAAEYAILRAPSAPDSGMGANLLADGSGASFRVWAPNASRVVLKLWPDDGPDDGAAVTELDLARDATNPAYYSADVGGMAAGCRYRFLITNCGVGPDNPGGAPFERVDPYARDIVSGDSASPAIVSDPRAHFAPFITPRFEDFIIYQAHIGSFAGLNDALAGAVANQTATFRQIADDTQPSLIDRKLDYVRSLGFSAIQFLPTTSYAFHRSEGYAPENFFAPEDDYGHPGDLRFLVDQCHRKGLAVIFDAVYNHVVAQAAEDRLLRFDGNTESNGRGIYFSTFDNFGPVPNFDKSAVRDFFVDNARMSFREYDVDGLRFDSAHAIRGLAGGPGALLDIVGRVAREFPDKLLIAEYDNPAYALATFPFGAAWQMGVADQFLGILAGGSIRDLQALIERGGYPHAFSPVRFLLGSHDQIYANYQPNAAGQIVTGQPNNRYFVERVGGVMAGRDDWTARAKARMGWALNVAMPGTPMLFMGSEVHHWGYWNPGADAYGDHRFNWALATDQIGLQMRNLVADANQVRWQHPALRSEHGPLFTHLDAQNRVLAFERFDDAGDVVLAVVNVGEGQWSDPTYGVSLGGDTGSWEEIFNSQAPQYGGWNDSGNYLADLTVGGDGRISMRLPRWSVLLFRRRG